MGELKLMKGNEALAEAAIRCGADAYFGYPITPQSEVIEYLSEQNPYERTGMVVLQAESELAAINMVYAAGAAGKRVMTSSLTWPVMPGCLAPWLWGVWEYGSTGKAP